MVKGRSVDIAILEHELEEFKAKFGNNYRLASERFGKAIDEIDRTITMLQKVKEDLLASDRNLRLANDKAQNLTLQKLTKTSTKKKQSKSNPRNSS